MNVSLDFSRKDCICHVPLDLEKGIEAESDEVQWRGHGRKGIHKSVDLACYVVSNGPLAHDTWGRSREGSYHHSERTQHVGHAEAENNASVWRGHSTV